MIIGGSVGVFMAAADIISPAPYYQSFEDFRRWGIERDKDMSNGPAAQLTETEIREQYDLMVSSEMERQVARAKNSLVKSFGWIAVPLPVFLVFSRRLRRHNGSDT